MANVEDKLDGVGEMNETLKKNSLDINILKFLPYRIDSLDNAIGNFHSPHKYLLFDKPIHTNFQKRTMSKLMQ